MWSINSTTVQVLKLYYISFLCSHFLIIILAFPKPSSLSYRQWSTSEDSGSLALCFPKKDLEKQVGLTQTSCLCALHRCPLIFLLVKRLSHVLPFCRSSTDLWICPCSNTMWAVQPSSSSASLWCSCLSQRSKWNPNSVIQMFVLLSLCQSGKQRRSVFFAMRMNNYNNTLKAMKSHGLRQKAGDWFWHLFLSPSVDRCWGRRLGCWFVCCCWPWLSVSQVTCRSVC